MTNTTDTLLTVESTSTLMGDEGLTATVINPKGKPRKVLDALRIFTWVGTTLSADRDAAIALWLAGETTNWFDPYLNTTDSQDDWERFLGVKITYSQVTPKGV